jgi:hypothetical protein
MANGFRATSAALVENLSRQQPAVIVTGKKKEN